jgi:hypothetical protein
MRVNRGEADRTESFPYPSINGIRRNDLIDDEWDNKCDMCSRDCINWSTREHFFVVILKYWKLACQRTTNVIQCPALSVEILSVLLRLSLCSHKCLTGSGRDCNAHYKAN